MIPLILLLTVQFCTAPIHPQFRTIPVVSDERGNLFLNDPFEQNEVQPPTDQLQLTGQVPLSVDLSHEPHVELSPNHISQPQAIRTLLTDEDVELQSAVMYHPMHAEVQPNIADREAHQQKISSTFSQGQTVTDIDAESVDTDFGTLLACGDLGPISIDSINIEPLLIDTEMEILLGGTCQVRNADKDVPRPGVSGSGCGQSLKSITINFNQSLVHSGFFKDHFANETGQKTFKCDICQKQYRSASGYRMHQRKHTGGKPFQCGICLKQFSTSTYYQTHRRIHAGENPFQCDLCSKQFLTYNSYRTHRRMHTGKKTFQCDTCPKQFLSSSNYQTHRRIHTGEKPFQCDTCSKQFLCSSNYQTHRRIHTGEKPFKCDFCQKEFSDQSNYQKHRRIHTGEKPFQCDACPTQFLTFNNYRVHRRIHTGEKPFQCDTCPKQFRTSSDCRKHRRIHTDERPFQCDICPKQFRSSSEYKVHRRIHTGEKPFKCDCCHKEFGDFSSYQRHRRIHTRESNSNVTFAPSTFVPLANNRDIAEHIPIDNRTYATRGI